MVCFAIQTFIFISMEGKHSLNIVISFFQINSDNIFNTFYVFVNLFMECYKFLNIIIDLIKKIVLICIQLYMCKYQVHVSTKLLRDDILSWVRIISAKSKAVTAFCVCVQSLYQSFHLQISNIPFQLTVIITSAKLSIPF